MAFSLKTNVPSFAKTTTLVARALGLTSDELRTSFQPARLHHLPSVMAIRRRVIGNNLNWDDARYLQWRYDFEGRPNGHGDLMVVAREDKVLGMIGTEKVRLISSEGTFEALSLMDIMVDPDLDGVGLGAWLNMATFEENTIVIEINANRKSIGLVSRLFHRLPNRRQYIAPLTLKRYLARQLRSKVLGGILAVPANVALNLWRAIAFRRIPPTWSLRDLTRFDDSVERLFARRWISSEITFERSSQYLNWRLFENPRTEYSVLAAFEANEMIAYAAYEISNDEGGLKFARIVDWLVDARHGLTGFGLLAQEIMRRALAQEADLVSLTLLHAHSERFLWRFGFLTWPYNKFATVGVRCAEPNLKRILYDGSAWFITKANTDIDSIGL